ncbi:hypothetical protein [Croceicoccus sp. YJ47]|uniref:hypothetical protein n=1 Tax=Croceicoccus sp. YJ47 TaxID=2798724 RepID=UPI00192370A9|nr:hypothetical protein [Croceicoccus sp. YJ47]QQN73922.1 hypothetical protein JD971_14425 [Croceicoccus sp. YJ47]
MTAQELIALAERVEALDGPDTSVDCWIENHLGLARFEHDRPDPYSDSWVERRVTPKPYTASLDAAMTLVPGEAFWSITMRGEVRGGYHACCQIKGPLDWREAPTPPSP